MKQLVAFGSTLMMYVNNSTNNGAFRRTPYWGVLFPTGSALCCYQSHNVHGVDGLTASMLFLSSGIVTLMASRDKTLLPETERERHRQVMLTAATDRIKMRH